jgi:hypothetical protein
MEQVETGAVGMPSPSEGIHGSKFLRPKAGKNLRNKNTEDNK